MKDENLSPGVTPFALPMFGNFPCLVKPVLVSREPIVAKVSNVLNQNWQRKNTGKKTGESAVFVFNGKVP